jgi:hypothetical protein
MTKRRNEMDKTLPTTVSIISPNFVLVRQLKFDTIRQETYWTTINKLCCLFKTAAAAQRYVDRIKSEYNCKD